MLCVAAKVVGGPLQLRMTQLTAVNKDMLWTPDEAVPTCPREVEWICALESAEHHLPEGRHREEVPARPATLDGFSRTLLKFTLDWPPLDLREAVQGTGRLAHILQPVPRAAGERAEPFN